MKRGSRASPVIKIASPVRGALPNERRASDRYPSGRLRTFGSEFRPDRAGAVFERPVTAEPARVISVTNPWARRIVTGLQPLWNEPGNPPGAGCCGSTPAGTRGHPGRWLTDLPRRLPTGRNALGRPGKKGRHA